MSRNPFAADAAVPTRLAGQDGAAIRTTATSLIVQGVVPAVEALNLCRRFGVTADDLMLHLLPLAREIARPAISGFFVGAVGRTASGDLILGGNLEFPGASLHYTLHGEGFVAIRAWQQGQALESLAIDEAHPCAHCRQVLAEFAAAPDLVLIDPLGHRLSLDQLYPWPFDPAYLGQPGVGLAARAHPDLTRVPSLPEAVAMLLIEAGRAAHAPYSGCPSAVVLESPDGFVAGAVLESVAFNPTLTPAQTAMVALVAAGGKPGAILRAWFAQPNGGKVDLTRSTADLLAAVAPQATLSVHGWAA